MIDTQCFLMVKYQAVAKLEQSSDAKLKGLLMR